MDELVSFSIPSTRPMVPWRQSDRPKANRKPLATPAIEWTTSLGNHCSMYRMLGAHTTEVDGRIGTAFAVWAPNATQVSVVSDRNHWSHGCEPLQSSDAGIWHGFIDGMRHGDTYKFSIRTGYDAVIEKADPYAFFSELRPKTASVVYDLRGYEWQDASWMTERSLTNWLERPVSIYEVQLGSWKRPHDGRTYHNYRELAHLLVEYAQEMGFTHLQLMPVSEFPFDGSWGYQATGYFSPTSRHGTPHDFMYFVDYCHQAGLGVLIDWVPGHFPIDSHSLGRFDGTCLYEHSDPRRGHHPDWGTYIFNYGRNEVRDFLFSSAHFWHDLYHVDGVRVDAVASMLYLDYSRKAGEWIPNPYGGRENLEAIQFLKDLNTSLHGSFPGILTIAEESTAWGGVSRPVYTGGLGFSMKWDMGWMNDTLSYLHDEPIHRAYHHNELSFRMVYAFTENFVLPLSHDEVVHGKRSLLSQMPGDYWQKFANLRLLFGYQFTMPGKNLLFMGGEIGQWTEWNHNAELDWAVLQHEQHQGLRRFVADLNRVYAEHPALYESDFDLAGFEWIQCDDWQQSVFAFIRKSPTTGEFVTVVCNFTPVPREHYRVGVSQPGFYLEILNSNAEIYGGSNSGNQGGVYSEPVHSHGRPHSLSLTIPPLGIVLLKPRPKQSPNV